jgi:2-polyprenyl-6-methoxyphenol hydroxylase-like FAD-dependent oxidoreductase
MNESSTQALIVGAGPVGLALASDLGWRGIACTIVEQGDGTIDHPRANAENARSMEFFRRWGVADRVRTSGTPEDFTQSVVYATALNGYEVAHIDRPGHGGRGGSAISPERPQRCNQLFLDPILRGLARSFPSVTLRHSVKFESFTATPGGIRAILNDLKSDKRESVHAEFLIDAGGGRSGIGKTLGIELEGPPAIEYNLNVFVRIPNLWANARVHEAAMYFFVEPEGIWRTLVDIDGDALWRLGLRGKAYFDHPESVDVASHLRALIGADVPFEEISRRGWIARDLVANSYGSGCVFVAGDAAHQNTPSGGFGMNTGLGDAVDLGWKLAARLEGWGGAHLLETYESERRPVAQRNVRQATENFTRDRRREIDPAIADPGPDGEKARVLLGERLYATQSRQYVTDGTALGYRYSSPIVIDDGTPPPPDTIETYTPSARPGGRAPHAWLSDGESTLDLFGRGFTLLSFDAESAGSARIASAFASAGVPLRTYTIGNVEIAKLYEQKLVLVRPDGHVAWRGAEDPEDPGAMVDRVRGA